jgi:transposase-like protein
MKKYSEEEKAMRLEDWEASGKSIGSYAKEKGLNPQTLRNWEKGKPARRGLVEVTPLAAKSLSNIPEILIEKGEIRIHIPLAINRDDLRSVIESLGCEL